MAKTYSTYEAKARFSELVRTVRGGEQVTITYRGEPVAEVVPLKPARQTLDDRLRHLEQRGVVHSPPPRRRERLAPLASRPGALARFLAERD